jgi:Nif-specific regulatory protein
MGWLIGVVPIIVGRDVTCTINLDDPIVSRHHCRIILENGLPKVEDMGSRNATFLNGTPVKESVLAQGDEVAVGATIFSIINAPEQESSMPAVPRRAPDTSGLALGRPLYSNEDGDSLVRKGRPRTTEDLVDLFNLGRTMSQAGSVGRLAEMLIELLKERLDPLFTCIALRREGEQSLTALPRAEAVNFDRDKPLVDLALQSMEKRKGVLLPEHRDRQGQRAIRTTMIAPIVLGREAVGAIIARSETPARMYDEADLEFLISLGHAAAPYVRAIERLEFLESENRRLVAGIASTGPIVGANPGMNHVRELARNCARSALNVLILGETGTGKELLSRMIHELSDLSDKPLVVVNCAAIPDELFESEVFGHERGAFTGAHASRRGLMEEANGGTLFLDEVGDLSGPNQARLLRAIETGSFRRLGGTTNVQVKVRALSATNRELQRDVEENHFRRDLFHRLNAFEIRIPPLRERSGDIPELAGHFLQDALRRNSARALRFSPEALRALQRHAWPGNVRELRNAVERAVVVAQGEMIEEADLNISAARDARQEPFPSLEETERNHIREALRRSGGNIKEAADLLGIGRSTLYRKIAEYNMTV